MIAALDRFGIPYSIHKLVPFVGDLIPSPTITDSKVWCMGGMSMGALCKRQQWKPGVIEVPNYEVQLQSPWRDHYLNRTVTFYSLYELPQSNLNDRWTYFIKPNNDSKFIAGQMMTGAEIKEWANRIVNLGENDGSNVSSTSRVLISMPQHIRKEARFWIVNDEVVTYSLYKLGSTITHTKLLVDQKMIDFAKRLTTPMFVGYWSPAKAYCLDLCEVDDDTYKIVEINNINSSGFYDCDMQNLVRAINTEI